ncbi:MAG: NAD(P)/FAD-dependent oxidoreductase [Candidatus Aenigmatarchaeota archaeon]
MYDIAIVGAGPVGLYAAKLLERNLKVLVLEDHKIIGMKACSGLYSNKLSSFVDIKKSWIEHHVKGARFHSTEVEIKLRKSRATASVMDRDKFAQDLAKQIKSTILFQTKVTSIHITDDYVEINTNNPKRKRIQAKMILGCDGANSIVRKHFGVKPKEIVNGLIAITKEKNKDDMVDLWFDKTKIKDGFFWKIPRGKTTEYGALGNKVTFKQLEDYFNLKEYEKHAAFIPTGPCKTYFNRTLLLGDAAGITKPWSFGGVIYGFTCAKIANKVISKAFKTGNFSEKSLKEYETLWRQAIGNSITLGMLSRGLFKKMGNRTLNLIFGRLKKVKRLNKLDMDLPSLDIFK